MTFAQVRRGQICKQGVVGSSPIVSTIVSTALIRAYVLNRPKRRSLNLG